MCVLYVDDFTALFLMCVCVCVRARTVLRLYVEYPTAILPFVNACCAYVDDLPAAFSSSLCACVYVSVRVRPRECMYVCMHARVHVSVLQQVAVWLDKG